MAMGRKCFHMFQFPQVLPLLLLFITLLAFFLAYAWSVKLEYVYKVFPYISEAGGDQPVSCVFGQLLNISAVIAFMIMYLRYKVVAEVDVTQTKKIRRLNKCSLVMGFICVLGLSIVGNFPLLCHLIKVHFTGAFMVFLVGPMYCAVSCVISYLLRRQGVGSALMCHTRTIITISTAVLLFITIVTGIVAQSQGYHRRPGDPGFEAYVVSTFNQWLMCIMFLVFFLTYYNEFSKISVDVKVHMN